MILFGVLLLLTVNTQTSQGQSSLNAKSNVPLGIIIDPSWPNDVRVNLEKTIEFINNLSPNKRHLWLFQVHKLQISDSFEVMRAGL
jgi:hypothetical protein